MTRDDVRLLRDLDRRGDGGDGRDGEIDFRFDSMADLVKAYQEEALLQK
jgi:hypothetical protein